MSILHQASQATNSLRTKALSNAVQHLLQTQIFHFLDHIKGDKEYTQSSIIVGAHVGQHLRHVDDHFQCLLSPLLTPHTAHGHIRRYDTFRRRESVVETSLISAKSSVLELNDMVQKILLQGVQQEEERERSGERSGEKSGKRKRNDVQNIDEEV